MTFPLSVFLIQHYSFVLIKLKLTTSYFIISQLSLPINKFYRVSEGKVTESNVLLVPMQPKISSNP